MYFSPTALAKEDRHFPLPDFSNVSGTAPEVPPPPPQSQTPPARQRRQTPVHLEACEPKPPKPPRKKAAPKAPAGVQKFVSCLSKFKQETIRGVGVGVGKDPLVNLAIHSLSTVADTDQEADALVQFNGADRPIQTVKVLDRKRLLMTDDDCQDTYFWIILHGTKVKDAGYLHDASIDLLAQEIAGGFVLMDRLKLKEHIYDRLPQDGSTTAVPKDAVYKIFRVGLRREMKTLLPAEDLLDGDTMPPGCLVALYYSMKDEG
jgi:hypothetical protein